MTALTRILLYGGLSAEEFNVIRDDVIEENHQGLLLYTPIGCISFCLLVILSYFTSGPAAANSLIYIASCLSMGAIMVGTIFLSHDETSDHRMSITTLVYAFMAVLYVFSISVSIIHAEYPAVSAIAFLLIPPLLFVDRPLRIVITTILAVTAVCMSSFSVKSEILALDDMWNAITFGAVALPLDVFYQRMRLKQLYQERIITYLSETDTLTGLRNRNNYEERLGEYPSSGAKVLVCAYADANGLHEMNNTYGHDAGDALLCAIAKEMLKSFGKNDTYRIGGDEFVAIIPDGSVDEVRKKLQRMQERLAAKSYSVSYGASSADAAKVNMRSLVREAEKEMYAQKLAYYGDDSASS